MGHEQTLEPAGPGARYPECRHLVGEGFRIATAPQAFERRNHLLLASKFSASISSSYRSPAQNAAVGGVPNSSHTRGTPSNPGAFDFVPPSGGMQGFVGSNISGVAENMIHDVGSGLHNHVAFFNKGGLVGKAKRTLSYAKDVRKEAKNSKLARQAVKAAIRAVGFAKDGKSGMAEKFTERAQKLSSRAAQSIPGLSSGRPGLATNRFD